MTPGPGADPKVSAEERGLQDAAADFSSAVSRFVRAFTGLFGLELRETGFHALWLGLLSVALITACVFTYLFLLLGVTLLLAGWLGGGWVSTLLVLSLFHLLVAGGLLMVLRNMGQRPLFPGTREAIKREAERVS
jgi:uncharacterized membrane protein YqjE